MPFVQSKVGFGVDAPTIHIITEIRDLASGKTLCGARAPKDGWKLHPKMVAQGGVCGSCQHEYSKTWHEINPPKAATS